MRLRVTPARLATLVFFVLYALAVTWPGVTLANRVEPPILGLPFNLFWIAIWIAGSALVLAWLYLEGRAQDAGD